MVERDFGQWKISTAINESRATSKTKIKLQSPAPTENAAKYHFVRVHLQVIQWKTLICVQLNPLDWG